jgi:putative membrane-bound dehydrogenase-like protein
MTLAVVGCHLTLVARAQTPLTGPATEQRFPPLTVPPGFTATLFACDPLIAYPSAIALGPAPGSIFVAVDYMTGLGTDIVQHDEIRIVADSDGDGYADTSKLYAAGFNSIEGLTFHDGVVYAMHAPLLTALRDTDGDGVADERRDLVRGLGLTPEDNPVRLHCANGLVMGHDGWLYLALGDHGCDVSRPEGDRLTFHGGGILRCRPDGRDLVVFASGLRNIYDVALDAELNVFVRDNENDGGDYKIRVCHSFFGADHGYPYLYYERPDEALTPLADLGLGSSAGGVCYLEDRFPPEYRDNLFFCEWGRSVVRYPLTHTGGAFAPVTEHDFAVGASNDPYGFRPTDVVIERDGSLIVADWADGQRPKRGRARIYRFTYGQNAARDTRVDLSLAGRIAQLDSPSYLRRVDAQIAIVRRGSEGLDAVRAALREKRLGVYGRLHAVWILRRSRDDLFRIAESDPDSRVRAQAVRALADVFDPVLVEHRLDAATGDAQWARRLAGLADGEDARVRLEVVVALGRLRWRDAPDWLARTLPRNPGDTLAHAAMQTLRRSANWAALLKLLDRADDDPIRPIVLRAMANRAEPELVDGLLARLSTESVASRRRAYADLLARVCRTPAPWTYWGYRPPPRPANTVDWERTAAITSALNRTLADPDAAVRLAVLERMQRENITPRLETLGAWLRTERGSEPVAAILQSLSERTSAEVHALLDGVVRQSEHATENRLRALTLLDVESDASLSHRLFNLATDLEDGPILADALGRVSRGKQVESKSLLFEKLTSPEAVVRSAAVEGLIALEAADAGARIAPLLSDADDDVRRAAAAAMGRLGVRDAVEILLALGRDADVQVRDASLDSLRRLEERRVVPMAVEALGDRATQLTALACIGALGGPSERSAVADLARRNPTPAVLLEALRILPKLRGTPTAVYDEEVGRVQGAGGVLARWHVVGPVPTAQADSMRARLSSPPSSDAPTSRVVFATGVESRVELEPTGDSVTASQWFGFTDVVVDQATPVQFLGSCGGTWRIWLNGKWVHERDEARRFVRDADRFDATLPAGVSRILVAVSPDKRPAVFHLRFRRRSSTVKREKLIEAALARRGDAERGREIFFDAEKALCIKCHRIGETGGRVGPDLTGVGSRFSRIYLIDSILEPSRTIAPSFDTLLVLMRDGSILSGVKVAETDTTLTLADNRGNPHELPKADIEEHKAQTLSTMPEGLEEGLTEAQFVDLVAFLLSQTEAR